MIDNNKRVTWYELCDEYHLRSMTIGEIKAEALEDFADRIYPGPTADTIIAAARAKALEYRKEATR